jgi:hypothetical protein
MTLLATATRSNTERKIMSKIDIRYKIMSKIDNDGWMDGWMG